MTRDEQNQMVHTTAQRLHELALLDLFVAAEITANELIHQIRLSRKPIDAVQRELKNDLLPEKNDDRMA